MESCTPDIKVKVIDYVYNHVAKARNYGKCSKILNTLSHTWLNFAFYAPDAKILSGMVNSVDPDQTDQEQSDLGLHCLHVTLSDS